MASEAFRAFQYNLEDVKRLIESHGALSGTGQGRRGLGHITRSGVVMLCAAWELYLEQVVIEGLKFAVTFTGSPDSLPLPVQKELSSFVRKHKNELKPLQLSGEGWKSLLQGHASTIVERFNTPKSSPTDDMFNKLLGLSNLSECWTIGADAVDKFVSARGDIAHRGRHSDYVKIWQLQNQKNDIFSAAIDTDGCVAEYVRDNFSVPRKPWNAVN